jgi:esterase/lipase superfamily enzyme
VLLATGVVAVGLVGTYSYWENYYVHRGFAAPRRLAGASPGRLFKVRFYSTALGRQADYMVYLPSGYSGFRRLPVFYLLHGIPGRPISYSVIGHIEVRLDNLISRARVPRMILVFPDGRIAGSTFSDSEWANTFSGRFDSYVVEVVHDVDRRFATLPERSQRVIGGLSAGGYGAINVALHHLDVFANVQVWSGYFSQKRTGVFSAATPAELAYNSPIDYLRTVRRRLDVLPLRVFLLTGGYDPGQRAPAQSDGSEAEDGGRGGELRRVSRRPRLGAVERPPRPDARPRRDRRVGAAGTSARPAPPRPSRAAGD